jgi:hypothetical protein
MLKEIIVIFPRSSQFETPNRIVLMYCSLQQRLTHVMIDIWNILQQIVFLLHRSILLINRRIGDWSVKSTLSLDTQCNFHGATMNGLRIWHTAQSANLIIDSAAYVAVVKLTDHIIKSLHMNYSPPSIYILWLQGFQWLVTLPLTRATSHRVIHIQ